MMELIQDIERTKPLAQRAEDSSNAYIDDALHGDLVDFLVVGGGPAGLSAALYAARSGYSVRIIEPGVPGGQINQSPWVENFPGVPSGATGEDLAARMTEHALSAGAELVMDAAQSVTRVGERFVVEGWAGTYSSRVLVAATGSTPRRLGIPGEQELWGRGVSTCATCDGPFFRDRDVVVIGGGDAAVVEAMHLARLSRVTLVHRRAVLRSRSPLARKLEGAGVRLMLGYRPASLVYDQVEVPGQSSYPRLRAVQLESVSDSADHPEIWPLPCDGLFVAIGQEPEATWLGDLVERTESGHVRVSGGIHTSVPLLYAAGDLSDPDDRQVITAAAAGARAAMHAARALELID